MKRALLRALVALWLGLLLLPLEAADAHAHYMGTALLVLKEREPGRYLLRFMPSLPLRKTLLPVDYAFPEQCQRSAGVLDCGEQGLRGDLVFENLPMHAEVVIRITPLSGTTVTHVLSGGQSRLRLDAGGSVDRGGGHDLGSILGSYGLLGIEHIATGFDHLLFVLGLVAMLGLRRKLIWTITAFTLAHSLTLALGALGRVGLGGNAVEAVIALSLVLVAVEALSQRETVSRRFPWLVAFTFGLVHGLGFAGALRSIGLPESDVPLALLSFNLGVEAGQLAVLALLAGARTLALRLTPTLVQRPPTAISYLVGSCGAYWFMARAVSLWP